MRTFSILVGLTLAGCASVANITPNDPDLPTVEPDPDPDPDPDPEPEPLLDDPVVDLAVALHSVCVTRESGAVTCWGKGPFTHDWDQAPLPEFEITDGVSLSGMAEHACVLHEDRTVSCWGWDHHKQLGLAAERNERLDTPTPLPEVSDVLLLSSGHHHVCTLRTDEQIWCWGEPYSNAIGPDVQSTRTPIRVSLPEVRIRDVSANKEQTCAVGESGTTYCWGDLGVRASGLADYSGQPVELPMPIDAVRVDAGWFGGCSWDAEGHAWCWGRLGDEEWPARLDLPPVQDISASYYQTCALLLDDGRLWCDTALPSELEGQGGFTHLDVSLGSGCAAHETGRVACWTPESEVVWTELEGSR
ncbi:MAG: RCC1 domain-containing protein [Myxococcota bacterium]